MKITREQFEQALIAGRVAVSVGPGARTRYESAISAALASLGIEIEQERAVDDEMVWVARSWLDVREGDIVRPPGSNAAAIASNVGPVNNWHAAPNASQYAPNESPAEWSSINVTLEMLDSDAKWTPPYGMKPDAPVEIQVTRAELAAIEACGGWSNRVGVTQ